MAGKKKGTTVPMLSPENYIRQKARSLQVFECWVNSNWLESGLANLFVARKHTNGNITMGIYLVDLKCLGVKDTTWRFNIPEFEYREILQYGMNSVELEQIPYALAHNIVFAGIEFAEEFSFKPHGDFSSVSQYILEEDTDEIELIDIECGTDGKPMFVPGPNNNKAQIARIIAQLEKTAGPGNYYFMDNFEDEDESEAGEDFDIEDDFDVEEFCNSLTGSTIEEENLKELLQETSEGFQFKITLNNVDNPKVWRGIIVPSHYSFLNFSLIINEVFGWCEEHLFLFSPEGWNSYPVIQNDEFNEFDGGPVLEASKTCLSDIFKEENQKFTYIYDFGDDWIHEIVLEKMLPEKINVPACIAGEGACPPEDCGGVPGYAHFKEVMSNPSDPEYGELKEWVDLDEDEEWDPYAFDPEWAHIFLSDIFSIDQN